MTEWLTGEQVKTRIASMTKAERLKLNDDIALVGTSLALAHANALRTAYEAQKQKLK